MMKAFKYYDNTESQFITPEMQEHLDAMRPTVIQAIIGLRKANPDASPKYVYWLWGDDPDNNKASEYEVAAGFFTDIFRKNIDRGLKLAGRLKHSVNHWRENRSVRIRSVNGLNTNIKNMQDYEATANRLNREAHGCTTTIRDDTEVIELPAREKRKLSQKLKEKMEMEIASRRAPAPQPTNNGRKKNKRS